MKTRNLLTLFVATFFATVTFVGSDRGHADTVSDAAIRIAAQRLGVSPTEVILESRALVGSLPDDPDFRENRHEYQGSRFRRDKSSQKSSQK